MQQTDADRFRFLSKVKNGTKKAPDAELSKNPLDKKPTTNTMLAR